MFEDEFEGEEFVEPNLVGIQIQPNSCYCGTSLSTIQLPHQCIILGILRSDQVILPSDNPILNCEDYIVAMAIDPGQTPALRAMLKRTYPLCHLSNPGLVSQQLPHQKSVHFGHLRHFK